MVPVPGEGMCPSVCVCVPPLGYMGWGHAAPLSAGLGARSGFPYIAASDPTRCQRVTQGGRTQRDGGSCGEGQLPPFPRGDLRLA